MACAEGQGGRQFQSKFLPGSRLQLWALAQALWLASHVPRGMTRALSKLSNNGVRLHDSITLKDYEQRARIAA